MMKRLLKDSTSQWDLVSRDLLDSAMKDSFAEELHDKVMNRVGQKIKVNYLDKDPNHLIVGITSDKVDAEIKVPINRNQFRRIEDVFKYCDQCADEISDKIIDSYENIKSASTAYRYNDYSDASLQPPDPKDPRAVIDKSVEINLSLDKVEVSVDDKGDWDFVFTDPYPEWAINPDSSDEWWYDTENNVRIVDPGDMTNNVGDLIEPYIPGTPGKYQISCDVGLVYDIEDLEIYDNGEPIDSIYYEEETYTDNMSVEFNFSDSYVDNFKFSAISE